MAVSKLSASFGENSSVSFRYTHHFKQSENTDPSLFSLVLAVRERQEDQENITKVFVSSPFPSQPMQQLSSLSLPTAEYLKECFKQSSASEQGGLS